MFVTEEEIQQVNEVWGNRWEETFFEGEGGVSLNIIIMREGVEINFCLTRGEYDSVLGHISPISQNPPPRPPPGNYCTVPYPVKKGLRFSFLSVCLKLWFIWKEKQQLTKPMRNCSLFNFASQSKDFKSYILHLLTHFIHAVFFFLTFHDGSMDWLLKIVSCTMTVTLHYKLSSCLRTFFYRLLMFSNNETWFSHLYWTLASTPIYWLHSGYNHFRFSSGHVPQSILHANEFHHFLRNSSWRTCLWPSLVFCVPPSSDEYRCFYQHTLPLYWRGDG